MKKIFLTLVLVFSITSTLISQENETAYMEVTGIAEKEIIPDEIYIDIQLKERVEKGKKLTLDFLENQLKQELKSIGIPQENLFIGNINAILAKTGWWKEEVLSVAKYNLKVTNATKMKLLFECFKKLKINNVNIVKATHSKIKELQKENRIAAIKAAKQKASYLLGAIDAKVGKPFYVKENNIVPYQNRFANANNIIIRGISSINSKFKSEEKKVIQFEKIKLSSSVFVKFTIE
jgi:uncharacterized protein YggE